MELLERDAAFAQLTAAREAAARGEGRVVIVVGEPGIGKTAVVTEFVAGLDPRARVLVGACDDLSIPRPLGPIHDGVGRIRSGIGGNRMNAVGGVPAAGATRLHVAGVNDETMEPCL